MSLDPYVAGFASGFVHCLMLGMLAAIWHIWKLR
jgi:hypothetical protein